MIFGEEPDEQWLAANPDVDPEIVCGFCGGNIMIGPRSDQDSSFAMYCKCSRYL